MSLVPTDYNTIILTGPYVQYYFIEMCVYIILLIIVVCVRLINVLFFSYTYPFSRLSLSHTLNSKKIEWGQFLPRSLDNR